MSCGCCLLDVRTIAPVAANYSCEDHNVGCSSFAPNYTYRGSSAGCVSPAGTFYVSKPRLLPFAVYLQVRRIRISGTRGSRLTRIKVQGAHAYTHIRRKWLHRLRQIEARCPATPRGTCADALDDRGAKNRGGCSGAKGAW